MLPENLYVHESTVIALSRDGAVVRLKLEGAHLGDLKTSGTINFLNVRQLLIDGMVSSEIGMELSDGEVLTLSCTNEESKLIIEWNDFQSHTSITKSYVIACDGAEFVR